LGTGHKGRVFGLVFEDLEFFSRNQQGQERGHVLLMANHVSGLGHGLAQGDSHESYKARAHGSGFQVCASVAHEG
jgi:hypothetical protein